MVDIHHAISKIYPDALYRVVDATAPPVVESIAEWLDARPIPTQGQLDTAAVECQAELDAEAAQQAVQDAAVNDATAITNWATWTEAQAVAWIDSNLVDGPEKTAIRAMARMVIALRNAQWPGLEGG